MALPNSNQVAAINYTDGPVLIIAGPGSGKTFTLVERVINLIVNHDATAESLFVVTFTEKAARELTTRISNRLLEKNMSFNLNEMYLGTFHSICLRILEEYREHTRLKSSFSLLDQFDQYYFIYQNLYEFREIEGIDLIVGREQSGRWYQTIQLTRWLNKASEEYLDIESLKCASEAEMSVLGHCFEKYQLLLLESNSLDFSGIQYEALRLLQNNPNVLEDVRSKVTHLMVDEYQDTNTIQESILFLLAGSSKNLCVVGDDDQGLYRFRGATIRNILEYPLKFELGECQQERLVTNYRSHPDIIEFCNTWISDQSWSNDGSSFRFEKLIEPRNEEFPKVSAVLKLSQQNGASFEEEVLIFLRALKASDRLVDWNQVAFLFKSVKSEKVLSLARYLEEHGIPVYSPRSNLFFERTEIRLMIGALIFLFPQFSSVRKVRPEQELAIWNYFDNHCFVPFTEALRNPENARLLAWARALAKKHLNMTRNADYSFSDLFYQLLQFRLFSQFLDDEQLEGVDKGRSARNLAMLSQLLAKFEYLHFVSVLNPTYLDKNIRDLFNHFFRFLYDGGINEYEDESEYAPSGCVSFLTIHQSKGLEFPVVICGSLESVPRKQWSNLDIILEKYLSKPPFEPIEQTKYFDFRRLFYTAFSRAQNLLVLATETREGRGRSPSKYFEKYFSALPSWRDPNFDLKLMKFDLVKEINLKREYSFTSDIMLFENCPEQYRFFKELEFKPRRAGAQLFGALVHQTIEDVHKSVLRGEEQVVTAERIESWFNSNYHHLSKREHQYLAPSTRTAALNHILRYVHRERDKFHLLAAAEVDISLVKERYILKGSVDLIRGEGGTVELIDFKSEKKPNLERNGERLIQYRHQLDVYAHLVEKRTGLEVSKTHIYYTGEDDGNPYVSFDKDDKVIDATVASLDVTVSKIEKRDYSLRERPTKLCMNCDMRAYCDMKNWKFTKGD